MPTASGRTIRRLPRQIIHPTANSKASTIAPMGAAKGGFREGKFRGVAIEGAVVVTVTVMLLPGVAEVGETVQVDSEGAPAQVNATV
jgi:hypothetical protein